MAEFSIPGLLSAVHGLMQGEEQGRQIADQRDQQQAQNVLQAAHEGWQQAQQSYQQQLQQHQGAAQSIGQILNEMGDTNPDSRARLEDQRNAHLDAINQLQAPDFDSFMHQRLSPYLTGRLAKHIAPYVTALHGARAQQGLPPLATPTAPTAGGAPSPPAPPMQKLPQPSVASAQSTGSAQNRTQAQEIPIDTGGGSPLAQAQGGQTATEAGVPPINLPGATGGAFGDLDTSTGTPFGGGAVAPAAPPAPPQVAAKPTGTFLPGARGVPFAAPTVAPNVATTIGLQPPVAAPAQVSGGTPATTPRGTAPPTQTVAATPQPAPAPQASPKLAADVVGELAGNTKPGGQLGGTAGTPPAGGGGAQAQTSTIPEPVTPEGKKYPHRLGGVDYNTTPSLPKADENLYSTAQANWAAAIKDRLDNGTRPNDPELALIGRYQQAADAAQQAGVPWREFLAANRHIGRTGELLAPIDQAPKGAGDKVQAEYGRLAKTAGQISLGLRKAGRDQEADYIDKVQDQLNGTNPYTRKGWETYKAVNLELNRLSGWYPDLAAGKADAGEADKQRAELEKGFGESAKALTSGKLMRPDDFLAATKNMAFVRDHPLLKTQAGRFTIPGDLDPTPRSVERQVLGPVPGVLPIPGGGAMSGAVPGTTTQTVMEQPAEAEARVLAAAGERLKGQAQKSYQQKALNQYFGLIKSSEFRQMDDAGRASVVSGLNTLLQKVDPDLAQLPPDVKQVLSLKDQTHLNYLNSNLAERRRHDLETERARRDSITTSQALADARINEINQKVKSALSDVKLNDQQKATIREYQREAALEARSLRSASALAHSPDESQQAQGRMLQAASERRMDELKGNIWSTIGQPASAPPSGRVTGPVWANPGTAGLTRQQYAAGLRKNGVPEADVRTMTATKYGAQ